MNLFVLENGNADDEFVLLDLVEFPSGFVFALVLGNQGDEVEFLSFNFPQVSDIGAVPHTAHHHAVQATESRHGRSLETETFGHPYFNSVGVDVGFVLFAVITQQFFCAFLAENHVIIAQGIRTVILRVGEIHDGVNGILCIVHVGVCFGITWNGIGEFFLLCFDFQAFGIFKYIDRGRVLFRHAFGVAFIG